MAERLTRRLGRTPNSIREMREVYKAKQLADRAQEKTELVALNKEQRLQRKAEKYRQQRAQQVEQHIPTSRICPVCKRPKPNNQQWTLVKGTSICICQGCIRVHGSRLARLTKLYENLKN